MTEDRARTSASGATRLWRTVRDGLVAVALAATTTTGCVYKWHDLPALSEVDAMEGKLRVDLRLRDGSRVKGALRHVDVQRQQIVVAHKVFDRGQWVDTQQIRVDAADVVEGRIGDIDVPATVLASVGAGVGVTAAATVVIVIIVLLTKSSCPFVYVQGPDGALTLIGEGYSGAVAEVLQRADAIPLPRPAGDRVDVVLSDEADETQYTDAAWLLVADHAPGERALVTADGRVVLAGPALPAGRVVDLDGSEVTRAVSGGAAWITDMHAAAARDHAPRDEGLVATFGPAPARPALELELANQPWVDVVAGHVWRAFGGRLPAVQARGRDPERRDALVAYLRDAGLHLQVEVQQADGAWTTAGWVPPVGWAGARRLVVPLDGVAVGEPLVVRVRGGVGFHRVSWLGVTAITDPDPPITVAHADRAVGSDGADERASLARADGRHQVLPDRGATVSVSFPLPPPAEGAERDVFLHLEGYYEVHQRPDARLEPLTVWRLARQPERMSDYSVALYRQLQHTTIGGVE